MPRDFQILGPAIVQLRFSSAVPLAQGASQQNNSWQLGLTQDSSEITPNYNHFDILTDSYGRKIPADVLCDLADCSISFRLIQFDLQPLNLWLAESLAGGGSPFTAGVMPYAGVPMGGGLPLYTQGNHYVGLSFTNFQTGEQWLFPATYLTGPPVKWPIGVERSIVECEARALPYAPLINNPPTGSTSTPGYNAVSSGAVLWLYTPPVPGVI